MRNEPAAVKFLDLDPIARVQGTVKMPGSKSISNRVLLLAALSEGETRVESLLDALRRLGACIEYSGAEGFPPLVVHAGRIRAGDKVRVRGDVSSQYLSALLMALPTTGARIEA